MLKKIMEKILMNNLRTNKNMMLSHNKMIKSKKEKTKKSKKSIMKERTSRSRHLKRNSNSKKAFKKG
jgi:vacuolar-type H+-ATPase subunit H